MSTMSNLLRLSSIAAMAAGMVLAGALIPASAQASAAPCVGQRVGHIPITARSGGATIKGAYLHVYRNGSRVCAFTNTTLAAERYPKTMSVAIWACGRTVAACRDYQDHLQTGGYQHLANDNSYVGRGYYRTNGASIVAGTQCYQAWGLVKFYDSRGRWFAGEVNSPYFCPR